MEAADNHNALIAQLPSEIIGLKNHVAGALDRAEEGKRLLPQGVQVAKREDAFRCLVAKIDPQSGGISRIGPVNAANGQKKRTAHFSNFKRPVDFEILDNHNLLKIHELFDKWRKILSKFLATGLLSG